MAIKNNPRVSVGRLLALAQHQVVRETRAAELPTAIASITAVDAEDASSHLCRIAYRVAAF